MAGRDGQAGVAPHKGFDPAPARVVPLGTLARCELRLSAWRLQPRRAVGCARSVRRDRLSWQAAASPEALLFDGDNPQCGYLADPAGGALIAGSDDAQWALFGLQRLAVTDIRQNDFPGSECRVELGQREDNLVAVAGLGQQGFAHARSAKRVAQLNSSQGEDRS